MKLGFALSLFATGLALGASPIAAVTKSSALRVHDTSYVRLADWSRGQGLEWRWLKREDSLVLSNSTVRLHFDADSREVRINGLQVWLLFPLVARAGELFIAQSDLDHTLRPLLAPPRNPNGKKIKTICLDAGHGGKDPGNRVNGRQEKDYTLRLASELRDQLQRAGFKVSLTRSSDKFIELPERPAIARRRKADLFVSLHFNATESGRSEAKGAEVYAFTPAGAPSTNARGEGGGGSAPGDQLDSKNLLLAHEIQKALVHDLNAEDRGVRRARFAVLRDAVMPAVLVEAGFMTHPVEGQRIFDATYRREMAQAIVAGIAKYKRIVERAD